MKRNYFCCLLAAALSLLSCSNLKDGTYRLEVVATSDGQGKWLGSMQETKRERPSLLNASSWLNDLKSSKGTDGLVLVDVGGNLSGDPAAFYYNYVRTDRPHLFPRLAARLGYDAVVPGPSDWETGHEVYDRVAGELIQANVPVLAGNAIRTTDGKSYFPSCTICKKEGLKIAILGFTNAHTAGLVDARAIDGITFQDLKDCVQPEIDRVRQEEEPDLLLLAMNTGLGKGDGSNLEKQGQDLLDSIQGADLVLLGGNYSNKIVWSADSTCLLAQGGAYRNLSHATIEVTVEDGEIVRKKVQAERQPTLSRQEKDTTLLASFQEEYDEVFQFANAAIGRQEMELSAQDAYTGSSSYMNFYHTVALAQEPVEISLQAPLSIDGVLEEKELTYNNIASIYPFANQLIVLKMTGAEIKDYLEASYDNWLEEPKFFQKHLFKLKQSKDFSTGEDKYSFATSPAHFDAAGGLDYTVDITKGKGERVLISSMADGSAFSLEKTYQVGITSYRAVGAGGLLQAAGIDPEHLEDRLVWRGPSFRDLIYWWLREHKEISPETIGQKEITGFWKFIPEEKVSRKMEKDLNLLFKHENE